MKTHKGNAFPALTNPTYTLEIFVRPGVGKLYPDLAQATAGLAILLKC